MSSPHLRSRLPGVVAVLLATIVLVAAGGAAVGTAREPPHPACALCSDEALAAAAADRGVVVETGESAVDVAVRAEAGTRWTVRIALTDGAAELRDDALRAAVVAEAAGPNRVGLDSRVDGDALVVTYRRSAAAERAFGAVLFTAFHASDPSMPFVGGGEGTVYPAADRLVLHAPEGYVPASGAGDGTVDGRTVRWSGAEGGEDGIDRDAVPTFVSENALFPGVRGAVARLLAGY